MMEADGLIIMAIILLAIYFLPTIVAMARGHQSAGAIFCLNLLLGWSLLGWIAALIWCLTGPAQVIVQNQAPMSVADEIQKLASLKEQGVLTENEFSKKKRQILESA